MSTQKAAKYACFEFERKFLLNALPISLIGSHEYKKIEDRYFKGTNLRLRTIRSADGKLFDQKLTQKYVPENSDFSKTLITNLYLSESEVNFLNILQGYSLKKNRYKLTHGIRTFSIDEFLAPLRNLFLAEIEFETEDEMNNFVVPFTDWEDVTLDSKYSGGNLAFQQ